MRTTPLTDYSPFSQPLKFKRRNIVMANWNVSKNEVEYRNALDRTIDIFHAEPGTCEFEELEQLLVLIKDYENNHFQIPESRSAEARTLNS